MNGSGPVRMPERLGPYRFEKHLGSGGMGEVFRAYDERLDRWVALKRLRLDRAEPNATDEERARKRFRREARAVAALDHPNIVRVFDVVEAEDSDWMVMELAPGRSLAETVRERALTIGETLDIGRQIADALAAAHYRGIVHRDLKVENVRLAADGRIKVLDFGLAKRVDGLTDPESGILTAMGAPIGTYRAMSPEQSRGLPVGPSSDLFSFGVLLYELITRRSPFRAEKPLLTLERIRSHEPETLDRLVPGLPLDFSNLVGRLMHKQPRGRPTSAREVADELARIADRLESDPSGSTEKVEARAVPRDEPSYLAASTARSGGTTGSSEERDPNAMASVEIGDSGSFAVARSFGPTWMRLGLGIGLGIALMIGTLALSKIGRHGPATEDGRTSPTDLRTQGAGPQAESTAPRPIYVAVPEAEWQWVRGQGIDGQGDESASRHPEILSAAVRTAIFQGLLDRRGLVPLGSDLLDAEPKSNLAMARSLAADEVLISTARCRSHACQLTLARSKVTDRRVIWTANFEVPTDEPHLLTSAILGRLGEAYAELETRPGARRFEIDAESYRRLLELRTEHRRRARPPGELLAAVEQLRQRAPTFPDIYLFAADLAHELYFHSKDPTDLDRASTRARQAVDLDPGAPEARFRLARLELAAGRLDPAHETLEAVEAMAPGDARIGIVRALISERRGHRDEALREMRQSARRHPSWRALYNLASLEYRLGKTVEARGTLERLLESTPESASARSFLAQLELLGGSLERAEALYTELARNAPSLAVLSNLGLARLLRGRYEEAAESFEQVLELENDHLPSFLNLADAKAGGGKGLDARELYSEVLRRSEPGTKGPSESPATGWQTFSIRAQALAHLGRRREAVATIGEALRSAPESPQAAYEAALVYTLVGELHSALAHAERALGTFDPRWFELPAFAPLRADPAFEELLASAE